MSEDPQSLPSARRRGQAAFTLIELLVVCAIIGILATIILSKVQRAITQARVAQTIGNAKMLEKTAQIYLTEHAGDSTPGGVLTVPVITGGWWGTSCDAGIYDNAGSAEICPAWKPYLSAIPENTINTQAGSNGASFVWNSAFANWDNDPYQSAAQQYPSANDGGFFFSRRYMMVMINNNQKYDADHYYWELGQSWRPTGILSTAAGFAGPFW